MGTLYETGSIGKPVNGLQGPTKSLGGTLFDASELIGNVAPSSCEVYDCDSLFKQSWHQLIVIGNGFDLECGLASQFEDFFAPRWKAVDQTNPEKPVQSTTAAMAETGLTVWDLILQGTDGGNWFDIEEAIKQWIVPGPMYAPSLNGTVMRSRVDEILDCVHSSNAGSPLFRYRAPSGLEVVYVVAQCVIEKATVDDPTQITRQDVYDFLLSELRRLEQQFDAYLTEEVEDNEEYRSKASALTKVLLRDEMPIDDLRRDYAHTILSFNYTRPCELSWKGVPVELVNVHGKLGSEIVFGIDYKDGSGILETLPFTKTYRLMGMGSPDLSAVVHGKGYSLGSEATAIIKFYGHSLSDPDYSYFQAIFDAVGLYEGNTKLVFYYRPWARRDGSTCTLKEAKEATMGKVMKLLGSYGETMTNLSHGRNLIHKLLIEGRLSVKLLGQEPTTELLFH